MEFAAMEAVPKEDTRLSSRSLPSWNIPFSTPFGTPIQRIFRIMLQSGSGRNGLDICISFFCDKSRTIMTTAANAREISVGHATPATPMRK